MTPIHGYNATVTIGGVSLKFSSWSVDFGNSNVGSINFTSFGDFLRELRIDKRKMRKRHRRYEHQKRKQ